MATQDPSGSKPWYQSLTVQGGIVVAIASAVTTNGPAILAAFGMDPAHAADIAKISAQLLTDVGAAMALIGRLRLGDLR